MVVFRVLSVSEFGVHQYWSRTNNIYNWKAVRAGTLPPRPCCSPYSVWQRFALCPIESTVNENFKVFQIPGFCPDHPQNLITCSCCHARHSLKISERSVHSFLSYLANRQTNKLWQKHYLLGGGNNANVEHGWG